MQTFSKKENLKKISKFCYHEEMLATLPTAAPRSVVRSARGDATAAFCLQRLLQLAARIISATASRRNAASEHPDSAAQCALLLPFSSTYAYYCTCHRGANRALVASLRHAHKLQPRRMTNSSNSITIEPVEAFVKYGLNTTCSEKNDRYLFQPCIDLNNFWQAAVQSKE